LNDYFLLGYLTSVHSLSNDNYLLSIQKEIFITCDGDGSEKKPQEKLNQSNSQNQVNENLDQDLFILENKFDLQTKNQNNEKSDF